MTRRASRRPAPPILLVFLGRRVLEGGVQPVVVVPVDPVEGDFLDVGDGSQRAGNDSRAEHLALPGGACQMGGARSGLRRPPVQECHLGGQS